MLYWTYTYVRNILSLFSKLFPGTLTICMALHGNPNFMKKTKLIFEFISNLVVLVSTVFIFALFFFSFPIFNHFAWIYILACTALTLFPPRLFSTPIFENLHIGNSPKKMCCIGFIHMYEIYYHYFQNCSQAL